MTLDAAGLDAECVGDLLRRPFLDVPEHEDFTLARREMLERAPDAPLLVGTHHLALRRPERRGHRRLVERCRHAPPPPPPARAAPVAAGMDRHAAEPRAPRHVGGA